MVYIFALIAILTASFIPFIIITTLIVIHELGHFLTAKILKVEVNKIYLYPLGGISKFFLPLNSSYKKELLILISGPLAQILAQQVLLIILPKETLLINTYHYGILVFNLLPIYPLDGGKLLHLFLSSLIPYKKSLSITINISYLMILILIFISENSLKLNYSIMIIFLLVKVYIEQSKINYIYERFILERYLNNYYFKNSRLITNEKDFYKNKRHIIREKGRYYLEKEYLNKKYKKN